MLFDFGCPKTENVIYDSENAAVSVPTTYRDPSCYGTQTQIFPYFDLKKDILVYILEV